jgi:hypothetical protein
MWRAPGGYLYTVRAGIDPDGNVLIKSAENPDFSRPSQDQVIHDVNHWFATHEPVPVKLDFRIFHGESQTGLDNARHVLRRLSMKAKEHIDEIVIRNSMDHRRILDVLVDKYPEVPRLTLTTALEFDGKDRAIASCAVAFFRSILLRPTLRIPYIDLWVEGFTPVEPSKIYEHISEFLQGVASKHLHCGPLSCVTEKQHRFKISRMDRIWAEVLIRS